jgi:hypothetical protein
VKPDVQIIGGQCFLRAENGEWRLAAIEAGDPSVVYELYAEADYSPKDRLPPIVTKLVNEVVRLRGGAPTEEEVLKADEKKRLVEALNKADRELEPLREALHEARAAFQEYLSGPWQKAWIELREHEEKEAD